MKIVLYCDVCGEITKAEGFYRNHRKGRSYVVLCPDTVCPICRENKGGK